MQTDTLPYLLALDILALTALIMAVGPITGAVRGVRKRLLLALFSLIVVRSFYLLAFLWRGTLSDPFAGSLEIISVVCIVWVLLKPTAIHLPLWRIYIRIGLGIAGLLGLAIWLVPALPWQMVAALVSFGGVPIIFSRFDKARWSHGITPLILGTMALLNWGGLAGTSQLIALIGYGTLVYAIFIETAIHANTRQREVETLGAEAQRNHMERIQFLEISSLLSAAPAPEMLLEHAVQTIGQAIEVDQVAILAFSRREGGMGRVAAIYRPHNPANYTILKETLFTIADHSLLLDTLESQNQITVTASTHNPLLNSLYTVWQDPQVGPTLLQPLFLKQKAVGVLVLGNPVSGRLVKSAYIRLCQKLSAQLAAMVAFQQEHQSLQAKAKELAAKLQFSQGNYEQLLNIVETINDAIIATNIDGRIHLVNHPAERLFRQSRAELLGQPIGAIFSDANAKEAIEKLAVEFSRSNQALPTYFEQDGHAVHGRLIPLRNGRQEWMGMVAVLRDVTAEVSGNETKNEFVNTLSQDLRTPLTTIKGYLDLMLAGTVGSLDVQQKHFLQLIKAGADKATEVINSAQRNADGKANTIMLDVKRIDVRKVIADTRKRMSPLITSKQLNFKLDLAPNLPYLRADEVKFRQIVDNLLSNACHFSKEKGLIALSAWTQAEGVNGHQSNYLIIAVADNGASLSPTAQRHIFEQRDQIGGELRDMVGETGLELAAVKTLVEAHGGRLWVESVEGKGNMFQVALPCTVN